MPEPSPVKRTVDQHCHTETDRVGLAVTKLSLEFQVPLVEANSCILSCFYRNVAYATTRVH